MARGVPQGRESTWIYILFQMDLPGDLEFLLPVWQVRTPGK